jgi:RNA polymerase sigma-70 factor (ECF subfamily)
MNLSESQISALDQTASCLQERILTGTEPIVGSSEAGLIQRILAGESEVFYELVRPHERAVFMTARAILRNDVDAEDAFQEAVLKAFANLAKFRGDAKFSTWLTRIAINEALTKLRKDRRGFSDPLDKPHKDEQGDYTPRDIADWREIPSEVVQKKELRQTLLRALRSLTPKHREVFILRDVRQFSIAETADLLGLTESAVKTRLLRARLQMRDALAPRGRGKWNTGRSDSRQVR